MITNINQHCLDHCLHSAVVYFFFLFLPLIHCRSIKDLNRTPLFYLCVCCLVKFSLLLLFSQLGTLSMTGHYLECEIYIYESPSTSAKVALQYFSAYLVHLVYSFMIILCIINLNSKE